jgi:peptide/nickel transport system permease protein
MRKLAMHAVRIVTVLLLGGFLGATLVRLAPGYGVDEQEMDMHLTHESVRALRQQDAGNGSLPAYYVHYLGRLLHGDLGFSKTMQQPVRQLLADRFPETLKSVGLGLALGWTLGLVMAIAPVLLQSWSADFFSSLVAGVLLCLPAAVLALLFVLAHTPGRLTAGLLVGLVVLPKVFRYARNLLHDNASQPHVLAAWAKGLGSFRVLLRHVLPVTAPQLLALAGVSVSVAFAAAIPVEVVCDLPGIGQLAWKAALGRDLELLVDLTMIVTLVTLLANSAADLVTSGRRVSAA